MSFPIHQRNMTMVPFSWVRWNVQFRAGWPNPQVWLPLGGGWFLQFGAPLDETERVAWEAGELFITRPETQEEQEDREEAEMEEAFMDRELSRYAEWAY